MSLRAWTILLLASLLVAVGSTYAAAHSWYDPECCSGTDCRQVIADDLIERRDGGWIYLPTGTQFSPEQVKPSRDRHFHVCIGTKAFDLGKPYCVYVLQGT